MREKLEKVKKERDELTREIDELQVHIPELNGSVVSASHPLPLKTGTCCDAAARAEGV